MKIITKATLDMETLAWVSVEFYEYDGPLARLCGTTQQQKDLATAQVNMYNTESEMAKDQYAQTQKIQAEAQSQWGAIFSRGPYQNYFTDNPDEWKDIMSQITTGEGQATQNALRATQGNLNALGGGDTYVPQGASEAIKAAINTSGAEATAGAQTNAKLQGYQMGADMFNQAGAALSGIPSYQNTEVGLLGADNSGGSSAESTQHDLATQAMAPFSILGSALGAGLSGLGTGVGTGLGKKISG